MTIETILLGNAQDAGVPQTGCTCERCTRAKKDPEFKRWAVSLSIVDHDTRQFWIIDATPDFREQLHFIQAIFPGFSLAGIILTHAHMGHYTGLIHLGNEAMNAVQLPVYCTEKMADFLTANRPWSGLIDGGNISLQRLTPLQGHALSSKVSILPRLVPHRDEWSDTAAYTIIGPHKSLYFCPDINYFSDGTREFLETVDVALLDACFFSRDELKGRNIDEIPHPTAVESFPQLESADCELVLVHLNHTNPLHDPDSEARVWAHALGFEIGALGMRWKL